MAETKQVRITHKPSGELIAEGPLGWLYWLPNPLFPFIWFRVAVPGNHPELHVELF
jgi:hypothetical protein